MESESIPEILEEDEKGGVEYYDSREGWKTVEKGKLLKNSKRFASGLRELMNYYKVGGNVGIYMKPSPSEVMSIIGSIYSKKPVTIIPYSPLERKLDPYYPEKAECDVIITDKPDEVIEKSKAKIIITTIGEKQEIDGRRVIPINYVYSDPIKEKYEPDSPALLLFTSGTSADPKLVILTHRNISSNIKQTKPLLEYFNIKKGDKFYNSLPLYHSYGLTIGLLLPLSLGMSVTISNNLGYAEKELKETKPDVILQVPLFYYKLREGIEREIKKKLKTRFRDEILTSLVEKLLLKLPSVKRTIRNELGNPKLLVSGGAPINHKAKEFFESLGIRFLNGYGITEASPLIAVDKDGDGWLEPLEGIKLNVSNGVLTVEGPNVSPGYYKGDNIELLDTGDLVEMNGDKFKVVGRKKNVMVLDNGENVSPEKLEAALISKGIFARVVYEDGRIIAIVDPGLNEGKSEEDIKIAIREANKELLPHERIRSYRKEKLDLTPTMKIKR